MIEFTHDTSQLRINQQTYENMIKKIVYNIQRQIQQQNLDALKSHSLTDWQYQRWCGSKANDNQYKAKANKYTATMFKAKNTRPTTW